MTVRFGDVEIPRELINAHEAGELVIFVGAGASMGRPSNLPSFLGLTEIIRDESQLRDVVGDLREQSLDVVMGVIEKQYDVDVHLRVAVHIGKRSSLPNALHRAVADLARCGDVRVVTTNYDTHLSATLGSDVTEYVSPALPIGSDFTGLVYLHGCVSVTQHLKNLVVTAGDFGKAYLTEAWAARFLERMFATYTTLFIGYSHNDVIMTYLARGLGPEAKQRYIFTHEPDSAMWKQLNIIPVGYSPASSHRALTLAVRGWATRASRGLLDHQRQVESIMDARQPAELSPEESSYLQSVVSDSNAVQFFCERAQGPGWLTWISEHPEFRALFDQTRTGSAVSWRLASWFAKTYVTNELSGRALAAIRSFGGRFSPQLWDALARRLLSLQKTGGFAVGIRPWLLLLTRTAPDQSVIFLDMLLSECSLPADAEPAALLFSSLTEPRVVDSPSVSGGSRPEVRLRGDVRRLHDTWNDIFKPSLEMAAAELLPIIDQHLRSAQRDINLSDESGSGETLGSPVHPIATSSGAGYSKSLGFLVEAARDCIETLLEHDVRRAESQLAAWASSDVALLRRLAIHGWTVRLDVDASAMVIWLAAQGLILDYDYQSEIAPFITRILDSNDTEAVNDVISDILAHANDDRLTPGRALRTLIRMRQRELAADGIDSAIATLIDHHKDLEKLLQAADSVPSEPAPLTTADELKLLLENDVPGAVMLLQQYAAQEQRTHALTWYDMEQTLAGVVRETPALGFDLLDGVDQTSTISMTVVRPVIRGWSKAVVDDELAQQILSRIATLDISRSAGDVAAMLAEIGEAGSQGTAWRRFATSRALAEACWEAIGTEPAEEKDDWYTTALNSPAGQLAIYWLHIAEHEHSKAAGEWQGLPPDLATELAAMLTCGDGRGELFEVVFGRGVTILHSIDPGWCEEHVLGLFDWEDDESRALRVWSGYLYGGQLTDDLLRAGLLQAALRAVTRAQSFREPLRHSLFGMLAQTALRPTLNPGEWIPTLIRSAEIEDRVLWADSVTDYLRDIEPTEVEVQRGRWMRSYWADRLESVPRRLNIQEASSMAQWVVFLSESVAEGVELALQYPAAFTQYSRLLDELSEQRMQNDPSAFAQLISHLLSGTELPFYSYELPDVLRRLRKHGVTQRSLSTIKEQALRLGISLDDN